MFEVNGILYDCESDEESEEEKKKERDYKYRNEDGFSLGDLENDDWNYWVYCNNYLYFDFTVFDLVENKL